MKYDVMYFIKKFDKIPENKWITEKFKDGNKMCALGHCGYRPLQITTMEGHALDLLFKPYPTSIISTNDYQDNVNLADTPRERVLNALCLINALESTGDSF